MNRKIFTLLAGAFLMLAMVFSVSAQTLHFQNPQGLNLGDTVKKLNLDANEYFHLRVTGVHRGATGFLDLRTAAYPQNYVLYMGNQLANRNYPIFIAELGEAGATASYWGDVASGLTSGPWFDGFGTGSPKSRESASSLWCTVVNTYDQGQNITFDFTNKYVKNQLLEVDITNYEAWPRGVFAGDNYQTNFNANGALYTPGGISGWNFSATYATTVEGVQPLFAYITEDTVAVLCMDLADIQAAGLGANVGDEGAKVFVKIAAVTDVLNNNVPGMLYFTLYEAAPFVLDAEDINTMFDTKVWNANNKLTFDPDVNPASIANLFTGNLFAEHIDVTGAGGLGSVTFPLPAAFDATYFAGAGLPVQPIYDLTSGIPAAPPNSLYDTNEHPINYDQHQITTIGDPAGVAAGTVPVNFDDMGYLYLRASDAANAQYLYAQQSYHSGNAGGDRFLTFGWRQLQTTAASPTNQQLLRDYYLYGQTIWRLVYYPSGDSIYINPYQATYLPTWDNDMLVTSSASVRPELRNNTITWDSIIAQSSTYYTFRATLDALEGPGTTTVLGDRMGERLRYERHAYDGPAWYSYYHRNYVTIQNLTGNVRIATLGNGSVEGDHTIDTRIYYDVYEPCKKGTSSIRTAVPSDLYLIRNAAGQYLHIPFYSSTDSARWSALEPDVHPELLPSYQWVVLKRYENSETSQITVMNREFDGTRFTIQLYNTKMNQFDIIGKNYRWNSMAVNHNTTTFGAHTGNSATFIALPKAIKENKFLGYEYIDRETAQVNVYSLNYNHDYDQNRYLDWKGDFWKYPNTDTTVYATGQGYYDRLYFKLDTALNYSQLQGYGFDPKGYNYKIPYLVQLERQPYSLNFEDPYKLLCNNLFSLINGTQGEYAMGAREVSNKHFLGTPIFNLRHTLHKEIDGKLTPYFALAQRLNDQSYHLWSTDRQAFTQYLTANYNSVIAGEIMAQLQISFDHKHTKNDGLMTGIFAARVDDQTAKLTAVLRADESTVVSTFRLVRDDDPIYRRFNTELEADVADDTPKTLKFFWMDNKNYELFENTGELAGQKAYWENYGIGTLKTEGKKNYLGYVNINQYADASTAIYVDTAYINRTTGWIKPQYLLVVDPTWPDPTMVCDEWGDFHEVKENYLRGRFLINATDSARGTGSGVNQNSIRATGSITDPTTVDVHGGPIGRSYLWENNWERLVFTDAIHAYDYDALYLVEGVDLTPYMFDGDTDIIDIKKLNAASAPYDSVTSITKPIRKIFLGNNNHKDAVFQMRLIERGAKEFIIESETGTAENVAVNVGGTIMNMNRKWGTSWGQLNSYGPMIAPCAGGWIKEQGGTAIISRSDVVSNLAQALKLNVRKTEDWPSANDDVTVTGSTVIGGNNAVTILGAAGKKVVISNILGQTVAGTVLSSDNATIAAPKGVVVVAIEGEPAVKTLVK